MFTFPMPVLDKDIQDAFRNEIADIVSKWNALEGFGSKVNKLSKAFSDIVSGCRTHEGSSEVMYKILENLTNEIRGI